MNEKKRKIEITYDSEQFNNENEFKLEKKYAFARFYFPYMPIFFNGKESDEFLKITQKYSDSIINKIKEDYTNKNLSTKDYARVKKDILLVPVIIKNTKSGKTKTIFEPMLPDTTIRYFEAKRGLKFYLSKLKDYKQLRDAGKQEFFIFDYGKEYSTKEEFRNIKMLIETTQNALDLINSTHSTQKDEQLAESWEAFLTNNIAIESVYLDYGYLSQTIENLPEFNKMQLDQIDTANKTILNRFYSLTKTDKDEAEYR